MLLAFKIIAIILEFCILAIFVGVLAITKKQPENAGALKLSIFIVIAQVIEIIYLLFT